MTSFPRLFQAARQALSPSYLLSRPTTISSFLPKSPFASSSSPSSAAACTCSTSSLLRLNGSATRLFSSSARTELMRKPTKTKLKTHKGAAKRWLVVGNGNYKRSKTGKVHLNTAMSQTQLNRLGKPAYARPQERKLLRRLLPYSR